MMAFVMYQQSSKLIININLTDCGQGWKEVEIPTLHRKAILLMLDTQINAYRHRPDYQDYIGENVDDWIQSIINQTWKG